MTSPIKPPGGKPPIAPDQGKLEGPGQSGKTEQFSEALQAEGATEATQAEGATSASGSIDSLVDRLRAGKITSEQAIEELVQRTLSSPAAAGLEPDARADLEATIRAAIADDPTFAMMQKDMDRR